MALEAENLAKAGACRDISFRLREDEMLGIAAAIGSGREELARTLAGFAPHDAGVLRVSGRPVRLASPAAATALGIGSIPRERRVEGLVLFLPSKENTTLPSLPELTRAGLIDRAEERRRARHWFDRLIPPLGTISLFKCRSRSGPTTRFNLRSPWICCNAAIVEME